MRAEVVNDSNEDVAQAFFAAFDQLAEQADGTKKAIFIVYNGTVGENVTLDELTIKTIVNRPAMRGKNIGLIPTPGENKLDIIDFNRQTRLGEIFNPPLSLLEELKGLRK